MSDWTGVDQPPKPQIRPLPSGRTFLQKLHWFIELVSMLADEFRKAQAIARRYPRQD